MHVDKTITDLDEIMKDSKALLDTIKRLFSNTATHGMAVNIIRAHVKSCPLSSSRNSGEKEHKNPSLDRFIQDKGSGHQEYKDLYEEVKENKTKILGIPPSTAPKFYLAAKSRMNLGKKYSWSLYSCQSLHSRDKPKKKHDGIINWARITLGKTLKPRQKNIRTPIGWIRASDHLAFSIKELQEFKFHHQYPNGIDQPGVLPVLPDVERVDLITPARYNGVRFAPLAIYIGYKKKNSTTPAFYAMTGGNAIGQSKVLYVSTNIEEEVLMKCNYSPTPFSSPENFYQFKVSFDKMNPVHVSIKVFTPEELREKKPHHFNINLVLEEMTQEEEKNDHSIRAREIRAAKVASYDNFIPPVHQLGAAIVRILQIQAAMAKKKEAQT